MHQLPLKVVLHLWGLFHLLKKDFYVSELFIGGSLESLIFEKQ